MLVFFSECTLKDVSFYFELLSFAVNNRLNYFIIESHYILYLILQLADLCIALMSFLLDLLQFSLSVVFIVILFDN